MYLIIVYSIMIQRKHTFHNSIAERLITVSSFETFHLKQLEYTTKDHIQCFENITWLYSFLTGTFVLNNSISLGILVPNSRD